MPAGIFGICLLWKLDMMSQACALLNWITSVQNIGSLTVEKLCEDNQCKAVIILDIYWIMDDIFLYKSWEKHRWTTYHHSVIMLTFKYATFLDNKSLILTEAKVGDKQTIIS